MFNRTHDMVNITHNGGGGGETVHHGIICIKKRKKNGFRKHSIIFLREPRKMKVQLLYVLSFTLMNAVEAVPKTIKVGAILPWRIPGIRNERYFNQFY